MGAVKEFLERSTIHGLSFIRDAKSLGEKTFWVIIDFLKGKKVLEMLFKSSFKRLEIKVHKTLELKYY